METSLMTFQKFHGKCACPLCQFRVGARGQRSGVAVRTRPGSLDAGCLPLFSHAVKNDNSVTTERVLGDRRLFKFEHHLLAFIEEMSLVLYQKKIRLIFDKPNHQSPDTPMSKNQQIDSAARENLSFFAS